jgi:hypothetical protein
MRCRHAAAAHVLLLADVYLAGLIDSATVARALSPSALFPRSVSRQMCDAPTSKYICFAELRALERVSGTASARARAEMAAQLQINREPSAPSVGVSCMTSG